MYIHEIEFKNIQGASALCIIKSNGRIASFICDSDLPETHSPRHHRAAWVQDALRQWMRMPEFRNRVNDVSINPRILSRIGMENTPLHKQSIAA